MAGGTFTMGSPVGQINRDDDECEHSVTVGAFKISPYEVTQADWRAVMGSDPPELNFKGCDDCPVERVSWNDIQDFLKKLNALLPAGAKPYRLPTEVEWEYAARGGNQSKGFLYSGSNDINEVSWNGNNSDSKTHPVGGKKANELGLYDLTGNVWEWCADTYKPYPCDRSTKANDTVRVLRGGSWVLTTYHRCAERNYYVPTYRNFNLVFRLAQD